MFNKRVLFPCISLPLVLLLFFAACQQPDSPPVTTTTIAATTTTTIGTKPAGPTVTVTSTAGAATNVSPIPITITFSEPVSAFELADLTVGNGSAAGLATGDNKTFTASLTPTAEGAVTVDIAAGAATSSNGGESGAAAQLSVVYDVTKPAVPVILSPRQGANTGKNLKPTVTWTALPDCTYDLQFDSDANVQFTSPYINKAGLTGTSYTPEADLPIPTTGDLLWKRYYLRIRATDAAGNTGDWSYIPASAGKIKRYVNIGIVNNDIDGDGYADVIVGAPYTSGSGLSGNAYIYFGGASMSATYYDAAGATGKTFTGGVLDYEFGASVDFAGDVNADGYADIIVGAPGHRQSVSLTSKLGRAYIYLGKKRTDFVNIASASLTVTGTGVNERLGACVSGAGDVNGDGYGDVLVGAPGADPDKGCVYLCLGKQTGMNFDADVKFQGSTGKILGTTLDGAGDVNADGCSDIIAGTATADYACLFRGSADFKDLFLKTVTVPDVTFTGLYSAEESYGSSVAGAGDVNGDGYADILIGAPDTTSTNEGHAYIHFGGASLSGAVSASNADRAFTGASKGSKFGYSVSCAGDVNGDGYDDAAVGACMDKGGPLANLTYAGNVFIYRGGASPDTSAWVRLTGEEGSAYFGKVVSGAGDLNDDGYDDVIGGEPGLDSVSGTGGRVVIFRGGAAMDTGVDVTIKWSITSTILGTSVASAGEPASVPRLWCLPFRKREFA